MVRSASPESAAVIGSRRIFSTPCELNAERKGLDMSLLSVAPEAVAEAAGRLGNIGSTVSAAHAAAAPATTGILPAAADEVSQAVASLFAGHGQAFQQLGGQAAAFHSQFVQAVNGAAGSYTAAEAANAAQVATGPTEPAAAIPAPYVPLPPLPNFFGGIVGWVNSVVNWALNLAYQAINWAISLVYYAINWVFSFINSLLGFWIMPF